MFALALLDLRKRYATAPLLFLARDPLGISLCTTRRPSDGFAFASEIRALVAGKWRRRRFARCADNLTFFLAVFRSQPLCWMEFYSLPPGHRMLVYVPDGGACRAHEAWWDATRAQRRRRRRAVSDFSSAAKSIRRCWKMPCART